MKTINLNIAMVRLSLLILVTIIISSTSKAQQQYGQSLGYYSGVQGMELNPANVVSSPYKFSFNLFNIDMSLNQNILTKSQITDIFKIDNLATKSDFLNALDIQPNQKYDLQANLTVKMPFLNVILNMGKYGHIGLTTGVRAFTQINNIDLHSILGNLNWLKNADNSSSSNESAILNPVINSLFNNAENNANTNSDDLFNNILNNKTPASANFKNLTGFTTVAPQIAVTYGIQVFQQGAHSLYAGFTYKFLIGVLSSGFRSNELQINAKSSGTDDIEFTTNGNFNVNGSSSDDILKIPPSKYWGSGWGLDLGFTYEWNPNYDKNLNQKNSPIPYKLKIGLSVVDLGYINNITHHHNVSFDNAVRQIKEDDISKITAGANFEEMLTNISKYLGGTYNGIKEYKFSNSLPTVLNLSADYRIYNNFFILANMAFNIAPKSGYSTQTFTHFAISPSFQTQSFGLSVPMSYTPRYNQFNVGMAFRIGGFYLGTDNLITFLASSQNRRQGIGLYIGCSIGIGTSKPRSSFVTKKQNTTDEIILSDISQTNNIIPKENKEPDTTSKTKTYLSNVTLAPTTQFKPDILKIIQSNNQTLPSSQLIKNISNN